MRRSEWNFVKSLDEYITSKYSEKKPTDIELECLAVGFLAGSGLEKLSLDRLSDILHGLATLGDREHSYGALNELVRARMVEQKEIVYKVLKK